MNNMNNMNNETEKEKEKEKEQNKLLDRAKTLAKDIQKRIVKSKTTRTKDKRPKIPVDTITPPDFIHPRIHKKNGGTIKQTII